MAITHPEVSRPTSPTPDSPAALTEPMPTAATAESVSKSYGDLAVLRDVTVQIRQGEVFGLLGPNGAGKTTLVECLVGLRVPDAGRVEALGLDPLRQRAAFTARVAVQPQEASLFESLRVREAIDLFASFYEHPFDPVDVIDQIGLSDFGRHPVKKLSGGQRRRLLLGVAMVGAPELMVLDEPSAGLDPQARRGLWDVIRRLRASGTTVVITTHHMDEAAELCDRVAFMVDGQIRALGSPKDLVSRLAAGQTVTFDTDLADTTGLRAFLRDVEGVSDVVIGEADGAHTVTVHAADSDRVLQAVAGDPRWQARGIHVDHGNLENVFLQLATTDPTGRGAPRAPQHDSRTDTP